MQSPPPSERICRTLAFAVISGVLCWLLVRFVWPLIGPLLVEPCPQPTAAGCIVALVAGGLWGLAKGIELEVRS